MSVTIGLPTDRVSAPEEFVSSGAIMEMAAELEEMGYDACWVTDHPAADARWLGGGGHHALDPFVALSFAAAATTRIRLHTHILVLAYRNPLLVAKSALSLDVLSGGRVILGVAAGYLRREFEALGVDIDERNELTDEAIEVLRLVWERDVVSYEGRHFRGDAIVMAPRPPSPRLPIWVGGNSRRALRRAAAYGDAWAPFPNVSKLDWRVRSPVLESLEQLEDRLRLLRECCAAIGRTSPPHICFSPLQLQPAITGSADHDPARVVDELHSLHALGVTWCAINPPLGSSRAAYLRRAERLMTDVVEPFARSLPSAS
jgi:probable F420-dependent oxidoreductase